MLLTISKQLTSQLRSQTGTKISPLPQVDLPRERTVIRHHTEQVDRTIYTQTSFRQSEPSPLRPKQQSASASPLQSLSGLVITKTESRRMHTPRNTLLYEPQAPSSGTLFESPPQGLTTPPEFVSAATEPPSRQDYKYPSAASYRPPPPTEPTPALTGPLSRQFRNSSISHGLSVAPENTHTTTDLLSLQDYRDTSAAPHKPPVIPKHIRAAAEPSCLPQFVSGPRRLDRSNSRLQGEKRIDVTKRVVEGSHSGRRAQKHMVAEECDNRLKDSDNAESNPITSSALDVTQYPKTAPEISIQRTQSPFHGCEYDPSAVHLPDTSDSREKIRHSTNSTPPLDSREILTTPPPALVYTRELKHAIRVSSIKNYNSIAFTANSSLRPPSLLGDSETLMTFPGKSFIVFHQRGLTIDTMFSSIISRAIGD